jgi:hypothetical protein
MYFSPGLRGKSTIRFRVTNTLIRGRSAFACGLQHILNTDQNIHASHAAHVQTYFQTSSRCCNPEANVLFPRTKADQIIHASHPRHEQHMCMLMSRVRSSDNPIRVQDVVTRKRMYFSPGLRGKSTFRFRVTNFELVSKYVCTHNDRIFSGSSLCYQNQYPLSNNSNHTSQYLWVAFDYPTTPITLLNTCGLLSISRTDQDEIHELPYWLRFPEGNAKGASQGPKF